MAHAVSVRVRLCEPRGPALGGAGGLAPGERGDAGAVATGLRQLTSGRDRPSETSGRPVERRGGFRRVLAGMSRKSQSRAKQRPLCANLSHCVGAQRQGRRGWGLPGARIGAFEAPHDAHLCPCVRGRRDRLLHRADRWVGGVASRRIPHSCARSALTRCARASRGPGSTALPGWARRARRGRPDRRGSWPRRPGR